MNIREYVDNPMGKGDSSIPNRQLLLSSLSAKYVKLTDKKKIVMKIYKDASVRGEDYYFHLVIPSETERDNTYDVVFYFSDKEKKHHHDLSIASYDCKIFSNCPSFAYTFAYVYNENGLMIESLRDKLGKEFFTKKPEVRNKYGIVNFDKYLYFGARYIIESKRLNKAALDVSCLKYNKDHFHKSIRSLKTIMEEYDSAEKTIKQHARYQKNQRSLSDNNRVDHIKQSGTFGHEIGTVGKRSAIKPLQKITKTAQKMRPMKKR